MNDYSTFLFARPSFLEGLARAIDLGGELQEYNSTLTPEQADRLARENDVRAVNADFGLVVNHAQEHSQELEMASHGK